MQDREKVRTPSSGRRRGLLSVVAAVAIAASVFTWPSGADAAPALKQPFAADSFWYQKLPTNAPLDPKSSIYAADIANQVKSYYGHANVNTTDYSAPLYRVGSDTPRVTVGFNDCQNKGWADPKFVDQMKSVPIPADALPASGTDSEMVIWQESTDTIWELWQAKKSGSTWTACWGGKITNASKSQGTFPWPYGVAATGLSLAGGMMRIEEFEAGEINHAIDMSLVRTKSGSFSWPASRTDGWVNDANAIPEGQRFRLDPSINVDSLNLNPFAKTIARALQDYGAVIRDKSGAVNFYAENPKPLIAAGQANPYDQLMGAPAWSLMDNFPWQSLQALPFDYGKPGTATAPTTTTTTSTTVPPTTTTTSTTVPPATTTTAPAPSPEPPPIDAINQTRELVNSYRTLLVDGSVLGYGNVAGSAKSGLSDAVGIANTASRRGYWVTNRRGDVAAGGEARHYGSIGGSNLNSPVISITGRTSSAGYYLLAQDGGVFSFGDAQFYGSTGAMTLNKPVVGMAATPSGNGYWLVASDGGIFSFGDAQFYGSTGALKLNQPVVGMASTPSGNGYWLVAADGGIFSFGDAQFYGSTGAIQLNQPIVGMAATASGDGYRFIAADGGVFCYGDATFAGSSVGTGSRAVSFAS